MILFSVLIGVALSQTEAQLRTARKIKARFTCDNFEINFTVTKRQLYKSIAMPKNDNFKIGIGDNCGASEGFTFPETPKDLGNSEIGTWTERQKDVKMPFFDSETQLEKCGSTIIQDEFGLVYELHVKGRRSKQSPPNFTPQTIIFSCFYPLANTPRDDMPQDLKKYIDGEFVIGAASMQFRQFGNLTSDFSLYDVQGNTTADSFWPNTETSQYKAVGGPVMVGVVPKAIWEGGNNVNHFFHYSARWDYFIRDCIFSGVLNGIQHDIQLMKRNCKSKKYHIQQLSKYGLKQEGHLMMFEAIAFEDAENHFLTCDVDVCLKTREGDHSWPGCYQSCNDPQFISQSGGNQDEFAVPTVEYDVETTIEPAATAPLATDAIRYTIADETQDTTQTIGEPTDLLSAALETCVENFENSHFYENNEQNDNELFKLCQYIRARFPERFE